MPILRLEQQNQDVTRGSVRPEQGRWRLVREEKFVMVVSLTEKQRTEKAAALVM
jgi:hypothetical protein